MPFKSQNLLPRWSIPDQLLDPGSRDALGFQRYASYFANRLLPNITVLTTRARYYCFVAWVIDEINTSREQAVAEGENRRLWMDLFLCKAWKDESSDVDSDALNTREVVAANNGLYYWLREYQLDLQPKPIH